jgi:hypothetical protein
LQERIERTLVEGRNHRLGDVRKEVVDSEAGAGKWVHPIVFEQATDDELQQELREIARSNLMIVEPESHTGGIPVDDHADGSEEGNAAQFGHPKLSESPTILCREIGQIVGELIQPIDAGTRAWKGLC